MAASTRLSGRLPDWLTLPLLLDIEPGHRKVSDQAHDQDGQAHADGSSTPVQAAQDVGDPHPVRERGAQRPGDDVREPERHHRVERGEAVGERGHGDDDSEKDP